MDKSGYTLGNVAESVINIKFDLELSLVKSESSIAKFI